MQNKTLAVYESELLFSITIHQLIVKDASHDLHPQTNKRHKKLDVTPPPLPPKDAFERRALKQ